MESNQSDLLKKITPILGGVLGGLILAGLIWIAARSPRGEGVTLLPPPTAAPIVVDVSGAVPRPGVYELPEGSRVRDAVTAAGGFLAEADKSQVNLAAPLEDGQKLEIPYAAGVEVSAPTEVPFLIDINYASVEELETLPGIGPTLAENIVIYREENGPFLRIEDIMNVPGIGESTFDQIKDLIYVEEF
ncbi:MAG: helix-hairpin-helix domain-containing protein [Chloroflexota bacterium]